MRTTPSVTTRKTNARANSLGAHFDSRTNSIGFLRVALATLVIVHHSFTLRHEWASDPLWQLTHQLDLGSLAVESFLVLSGFLIAASFEKTNSLRRYFWHRALRLYPAFWICLMVSVLLLAPLGWFIERGTLAGYFAGTGAGVLSYLLSNFTLWIRQTNIAGVFESHSSSYFNGSLWTLSLEATCYMVLPIIAYCGGLRRNKTLVFAGWLALCLWFIGDRFALQVFGLQLRMYSLMKVGIYFATGVGLYAYRETIPLNRKLIIAATGLLLLSFPLHVASVVCLIAIPYLLLCCAFKLPLVNLDRKADLSYSMYVYAYPIQQLLISAWPQIPSAVLLVLALAIDVPIAFVSWKLVEQPALRLKNARFAFARLEPARARID